MLREGHHLLKVLLACRMPLLFAARVRRRFWRTRNRTGRRAALRRLVQARMVAGQTAVQDLTGIDEQMKAVGDLFGLWRAYCGAPTA